MPFLPYQARAHLITDGVFCPDGTFEQFTHFDASLVERLFGAELLRILVGKGLICQDIVDNLLSWRHSGFSYAQQDVMWSSSTSFWSSGISRGLARP